MTQETDVRRLQQSGRWQLKRVLPDHRSAAKTRLGRQARGPDILHMVLREVHDVFMVRSSEKGISHYHAPTGAELRKRITMWPLHCMYCILSEAVVN